MPRPAARLQLVQALPVCFERGCAPSRCRPSPATPRPQIAGLVKTCATMMSLAVVQRLPAKYLSRVTPIRLCESAADGQSKIFRGQSGSPHFALNPLCFCGLTLAVTFPLRAITPTLSAAIAEKACSPEEF